MWALQSWNAFEGAKKYRRFQHAAVAAVGRAVGPLELIPHEFAARLHMLRDWRHARLTKLRAAVGQKRRDTRWVLVHEPTAEARRRRVHGGVGLQELSHVA